MLTLCCICVERYIAIVYPLRARAITARQRLLGILFGVWLLSLVASVPHAVWHTFVSIPAFLVKPKPPSGQDQCVAPTGRPTLFPADMFPEVDLSRLPVTASLSQDYAGVNVCLVLEEHRRAYVVYKWIFLVVLFILPTFFMIGAYLRVGCRLWDRRRPASRCAPLASCKRGDTTVTSSSAASSPSASTSGGSAEGAASGERTMKASDVRTRLARRVTLMLVMAMVLFVICWMPYLLFEAIALTANLPTRPDLLNARYYLEWLSVSNCCHNPIVYTLLHEKFRRILVDALSCRRGHSVHPNRSLASPASSRAPSHHACALKAALEKAQEEDGQSPHGTTAINLESSPVRDSQSKGESPGVSYKLPVGNVLRKKE